MCLSGISFPPLSSVIGKEKLQSMIDNQRRKLDEQIKTNSLAPGYREQAEIRLNNFEANISGNCEILFSPAFSAASPCLLCWLLSWTCSSVALYGVLTLLGVHKSVLNGQRGQPQENSISSHDQLPSHRMRVYPSATVRHLQRLGWMTCSKAFLALILTRTRGLTSETVMPSWQRSLENRV